MQQTFQPTRKLSAEVPNRPQNTKYPDSDAFEERAAIDESGGRSARTDAEQLTAKCQGHENVGPVRVAEMNSNKMKTEELAVNVKFENTPEQPVEWHEYAKLFPMLSGDALDRLREDIRQHGVREPIIFLNGSILDGRNRYMCARDLGIEYPRVEFEGDDPLGFVISHNLHRRHLTESQRAMVAAKLAKMPQGARTDIKPSANLHEVSASEAADMLNVSERSVKTAKKVERDGAPELVAAVETGALSVSLAVQAVDLPKEKQEELLADNEAAELRESVLAAVTESKKTVSRKNPHYESNPPMDAAIQFTGRCREVSNFDIDLALSFDGDEGIKIRMRKAAMEAKETLELLFVEREKADTKK